MSTGFSPASDAKAADVFAVIIECSTYFPAFTPALFDLLRNEARLCGFEDVNGIQVRLKLEMMGPHTTEHDLGALQDRIDNLWLGAHAYAAVRGKR